MSMAAQVWKIATEADKRRAHSPKPQGSPGSLRSHKPCQPRTGSAARAAIPPDDADSSTSWRITTEADKRRAHSPNQGSPRSFRSHRPHQPRPSLAAKAAIPPADADPSTSWRITTEADKRRAHSPKPQGSPRSFRSQKPRQLRPGSAARAAIPPDDADSSTSGGQFLDIDLKRLVDKSYDPRTAEKPKIQGHFSFQTDDSFKLPPDARRYTIPSYRISSDETFNLMDFCLTECRDMNGEPLPSDLSQYKQWVDIQPLDLTVGYKDRKGEIHQNINPLFQYLESGKFCDELGSFVCFRTALFQIAISPYSRSKWHDVGNIIIVQKVGSVFYMLTQKTTEHWRKVSIEEDKGYLKKQLFWGLNFESYVTTKPDEKPRPGKRIDSQCNLTSVVKRNIGSHSITVAGEVDCCLPGDRTHYLELKTVSSLDKDGEISEFNKLRWWLQSHLLGIKDIFCCHIDNKYGEEGHATEVKHFKVAEIEHSLEEKAGKWPTVCMNFLDEFLTFVKQNVTKEFLPYVFERRKNGERFLMKPEDSEEMERYMFLPASYVSFCQKQPEQ